MNSEAVRAEGICVSCQPDKRGEKFVHFGVLRTNIIKIFKNI